MKREKVIAMAVQGLVRGAARGISRRQVQALAGLRCKSTAAAAIPMSEDFSNNHLPPPELRKNPKVSIHL